MAQKRVCPLCGAIYKGVGATSRVEGQGQICPDCGTREALLSIGVERDEQDRILEVIHRTYNVHNIREK